MTIRMNSDLFFFPIMFGRFCRSKKRMLPDEDCWENISIVQSKVARNLPQCHSVCVLGQCPSFSCCYLFLSLGFDVYCYNFLKNFPWIFYDIFIVFSFTFQQVYNVLFFFILSLFFWFYFFLFVNGFILFNITLKFKNFCCLLIYF
jgi:hypothetical protein